MKQSNNQSHKNKMPKTIGGRKGHSNKDDSPYSKDNKAAEPSTPSHEGFTSFLS
jgi:hypothetical protein